MSAAVKLFATATAILSGVLVSACTATEPAPPPRPSSRPLSGLIPEPSARVAAYSQCLTANGATVTSVVGVYVLVDSDGPALAAAGRACEDKLDAVIRSLGDGQRRVEDNDGNRFWHFMHNCMETFVAKHPRKERDILVVRGRDAAWADDFDECVDIARKWPGESASPGTVWPPSPRTPED